MKLHRAVTLWVLALCLAFLPQFAAAGERSFAFMSIDYPGATFTGAFGINASGGIVGFYRDTLNNAHGFLLADGTFTPIDFPGAAFTDARGISPSGEIVGSYRRPGEPALNFHGYLLNKKGEFIPVNYPNHTSTIPQRITSTGLIVGCFHDTDTMGTMHGFSVDGNGFSGFSLDASMHNGITPGGEKIAGLYTDMMTNQGHGYLLEGDNFTQIDFPGSTFTAAWDINPQGAIVGTYVDAAGQQHGFLLDKGEFTSIDYPGARVTIVFGINPRGDLVGRYVDSANRTHGFLATRADGEE
jgi:uncharacterized membrane protein